MSAGQSPFLCRCFAWEPSRSFFGVAKNRHIGVENLLPPYTEWCKTAYFMKSGARHHRSPSKTWHRIESLCHVQESTCCRDWKGFCLIRGEEVVYFIWEKRGESRSNSTIRFYDYDFIYYKGYIVFWYVLGGSCKLPKHYIRNCNIWNKSGPS